MDDKYANNQIKHSDTAYSNIKVAHHCLDRQADNATEFYDAKVHVRRFPVHFDVVRGVN